jgi:hypothetical protein
MAAALCSRCKRRRPQLAFHIHPGNYPWLSDRPAHREIERVRDTLHLAYSLLRRTGLSVS